MNLVEVGRWIGDPSDQFPGAGGTYGNAIAFDGTYVYVGLYQPGPIIKKIAASTMLEVLPAWVDSNLDDYGVVSMTYDGTYIYAGLLGSSAGAPLAGAIVVQIDPNTMLEVKRYSDLTGNRILWLDYDGTYIYATTQNSPTAILLQINPATMGLVASWAGTNGDACYASTHVGGKIYALGENGLNFDSIIVQLDPTTMLEIKRWDSGLASMFDIIDCDGTYIYMGSLQGNPPQVMQFDPVAFAPVNTWVSSDVTEVGVTGLTHRTGTVYEFICIGYKSEMTTVALNNTTMTNVGQFVDTIGGGDGGQICCDATYVYVESSGNNLVKLQAGTPPPPPVYTKVRMAYPVKRRLS
jgi:hypothetical protein